MKRTKSILGFVMAVMMILAMVSVVGADIIIAQADALTLLIAQATESGNDTITLTEDIKIEDLGKGNNYNMSGIRVLDLNDCTLTIKGSYARFDGDELTIQNGNITGGGVYAVNDTILTLDNVNIDVGAEKNPEAVIVDDKGEVIIYSGTYVGGKNGHDVLCWKNNMTVYGGTFKRQYVKNYVADGYVAAKNENCTWTVVDENSEDIVAELNGTFYLDLGVAVEDADESDTITLVNDITLKDASFDMPDGSILDLNEKTITVRGDYVTFTSGAFTVQNGNIENGGIKVKNGADLTLIATNITANPNKFEYAVWAYNKGTTVIIESGEYVGGKNGRDIFAEDKANIDIYGGTFRLFRVEEYVADGYAAAKLEANAKSKYVVVEADDIVAKIGKTNYLDLQTAIDDADEGDTIDLQKDTEINASIEMPDNSTLNLNEYTITVDDRYVTFTDGEFTLMNGCVDGGVMVDGAYLTLVDTEIIAKGYAVYVESGKATIESGYYAGGKGGLDVGASYKTKLVLMGGTFYHGGEPQINNNSQYLTKGYSIVANENGTCTVVTD